MSTVYIAPFFMIRNFIVSIRITVCGVLRVPFIIEITQSSFSNVVHEQNMIVTPNKIHVI